MARKSNTNGLLSPISIGSMKVKNRLAVAAMVTVYCDTKGYATDRYIDYHEARAKGGWGLIITEDYAVAPTGRGFWTAGLWEDGQIASHTKLTERVKKYGTKIVAQIYHAGRQTTSQVIGQRPVAPSPIPDPALNNDPVGLTIPEIKTIVSQFGDTALRAKKAGFDGVEIHGAHGYLIAGFMSSYSNKRFDEYGGNLDNRIRFPLEIIADIRQKCGEDFTIIFRISANEFVAGGRDIEETKLIAKKLEKAGIDAIHVSAGVYGSAWSVVPPLNIPHAWIVDYAEEVKQVVSIPVITVGRIVNPEMADNIIAAGKADIVAMGRGSLADPELPNKYKDGNIEDICLCIGCQQGCFQRVFMNEPIRCLVNPRLGFEYLKEMEKASEGAKKQVVVVGGGPGGMYAALAASKAGHDVSLWEKNECLGGEFALAPIPPYKGDMSFLLTWLRSQLDKEGVKVKLNSEFKASMVEELKADTLIIATGAVPVTPDIKGLNTAQVVLAQDVLKGKVKLGKKVLVVGGGLIGAETATYCTMQGCQVGIVEKENDIAVEEETTRRGFLLALLEEKKVNLLTNTSVKEIQKDKAILEKNGQAFDYQIDTIVLALGMKPNQELEKELAGKIKTIVIGDAKETRNALEATRDGYKAGLDV